MIIPSGKQDSGKGVPFNEERVSLLETPPTFDEAIASSSRAPAPAATRSSQEQNVRIPSFPPSELDAPPPEFSTWDSEYSLSSRGDIYSHDRHLNEDGEALYRFLLEHLQPPTFKLHCRGTHTEQRVRLVNHSSTHHHHHNNGHSHHGGNHGSHHHGGGAQSHTELEEVTVVDFDFYIDLTHILGPPSGPNLRAEIWTTDHSIPAYRGSMVKQVSRTIPFPPHPSNILPAPAHTPTHPPTSRGRSGWRSLLRREKKPNAFQRFGNKIQSGWRYYSGEGRVRLPDPELGLAPSGSSSHSRLLDGTRATGKDDNDETPVWRSTSRKERKQESQYASWIAATGLPPWTPMSMYVAREADSYTTTRRNFSGSGNRGESGAEQTRIEPISLAPSMTVRAWADDYCRSEKILKDFKFSKVVYGWDLGALKSSIEDLIRSANHRGDLFVTFETSGSSIHIRPDTRLARAMANPWMVFLMWLLLIYPFLWLFRRFHHQGGGRWEVCGAAYALKRPPVSSPNDENGPSSSSGSGGGGNPKEFMSEGMKEGEWFRAWQSTIVHGVTSRAQKSEALSNHGDPAARLDGYIE